MLAGTLVLLHSPLTGPAAWGRLPDALEDRGVRTVVPSVTADDRAPYAARYVAEAALQIAAAAPRPPVALVGHSGAGPLLAQVGATQRAARRPVNGYVFLDAGLPGRRGSSRLELMAGEDGDYAASLRTELEAGGRFPTWTEPDLDGLVPDPDVRRDLVASLRPRSLDFFVEPLPPYDDWPDAPCAYVQTSQAYDVPARLAAGRGWPVVRRDLGHFAACSDPESVADLLIDAVEA